MKQKLNNIVLINSLANKYVTLFPLCLAAMTPRAVRPVKRAAAARTYRMMVLLPGGEFCMNFSIPTVRINSQNSPVKPGLQLEMQYTC